MKQLTIRGFDAQIEQGIHELAKREGISLNQAVLRLLRRGMQSGRQQRCVGDALESFFGTWSEEQAREVMEAVAELDRVDLDMWE